MLLEQDSCRDIGHVLYDEFHFFDVVDVVQAEVDVGDMHFDCGADEICCDIELEEFAILDLDYVRCLFIFPWFLRANTNINLLFFTLLQSVLF